MIRFFVGVGVFLCATAVFGQEFRGTVTGRVTDATNAAVPNAKVTAVLVTTGGQSATATGTDGLYTIPFLTPGVYRIEAEAAGFKRYVRQNFQVSAGERVGLDIRLELGQVSETLNVTAEAPILETTTATAGQVISSSQVENMPLNGRTPLVLAQLAFGVVPNSDPKFNRPFDNAGPSGFSMGGAPKQTNELLVDGAPDTTRDNRVAYNPPVDAVQEVRVHAFEADAAYGHTGGGTANVIMKSGTNTFHGSLYEFNQVSALAATPFFTNKAGQPKPVTRYNQWGETFGGPLWLPKIYNGKNKVFWFFGMEDINDSFPEPITLTVPTAAERTGDLSGLLRAGSSYQIYNPFTGVKQGSRIARQPFAGNVIPSSMLNGIARNYFQFYPQPDQPGRADGSLNYLANTVRSDTFNSEIGRLDFNIGDRNKMFWNFRHNDRIEIRNNYFNNVAEGRDLGRINWGSTLDDVQTFSPTLVADVRLNWSRFREYTIPFGDGYNATKLGFPAAIAAISPRLTLPRIQFNSTSNTDYTRLVSDTYGSTPFDVFQIFADVVKVHGNHSIKMGVDARELRESSASYGNSEGSYSFGTNWTRGPLDNSTSAPLGQDLAAFLLGLPTGGGLDINAFRTNQSKYLAVFVQDDWRVRPNLTLNLGLRFEHDFPGTERFDRSLSGFDLTTPNPIAAQAMAAYAQHPDPALPANQFKVLGGPLFASPANPNIYNPQSEMFSPRFGFAWTPRGGKTVIRGGTGVFMFPLGSYSYVNQPGFSQTTSVVPTLNSYLTPYATLGNPFPDGFEQPTGSSLGLATYLGKSITYFNPTIHNPYSYRWELDVQRELPGRTVLEAAYMANHAVHLPINRSLQYLPAQYLSTLSYRDQPAIDYLSALVTNPFAGLIPGTSRNGSTVSRSTLLQPFPEFSGVTLNDTNGGSSYFESLDIRVEKRYSRGLTLLANYTYSKLIEQDSMRNDTDLAPEKRVAGDDRPQRFILSGSYELPIGAGKLIHLNSKWGNRIAGGWVVNAIYTNQIGAPLGWGTNTIYYGGPLHMSPHPSNVDVPAFDVAPFNRNSKEQLGDNIKTFPSQFGSIRIDGADNVDLSLIKNTKLSERVNFQLRFESFNAFNRPEFSGPNTSPTAAGFGLITTSPNLPRAIQLAGRLVW